MFRSLVSKISGFIVERSHAKRRKFEAPIKLWFERQNISGIHTSSADGVFVSGETVDMSSSGIAFMVSSIRVKENYLVGQERILNAEIDLPGGKVKMQIVGRRYERDDLHLSAEKYLVGAEIVDMARGHRAVYEQFLRYGGNRKKVVAPSLEMGGN